MKGGVEGGGVEGVGGGDEEEWCATKAPRDPVIDSMLCRTIFSCSPVDALGVDCSGDSDDDDDDDDDDEDAATDDAADDREDEEDDADGNISGIEVAVTTADQ